MERGIKVAILGSRGVPARYGGYETLAEEVGKRLVKRGCRVFVFCPSSQEYKKKEFEGIDLIFVPNVEKRFKAFGTILYDILSLIKASLMDLDIVYMLGYGSSLFCLLPRIFGKRVLINTDGLEWMRSKWNKFIRIYLKLSEWIATKTASLLVSDSKEIQRYFLENYKRKSIYITNGANPYRPKNQKILKEFDLKEDGYYMVVARLEPENHILKMVRGFKKSRTNKKLFLVTNIRKTKYYYHVLREVEGDKRIIWSGPIYDKEKLYELRANAFAYLHGHSVGGTNPSLIEAMACGNIVIAFDVEFNREVLGENGFFFKTSDELASTIDKIEKMDRKILEGIGWNNRRRVESFYNWDRISEQYYSLFKKLTEVRK